MTTTTASVQKPETRVRVLVAVLAWTFTLFTFGYTLPWAIAETRRMPNRDTIWAVNILLGWTLIGWAYALWMSVASVRVSR